MKPKFAFIDCDGVVILRDKYFSQRYAEEFGVPAAEILKFFKNEFVACETGKADLKQEIQKYLQDWKWQKSADDLLSYWFNAESSVNREVLGLVTDLRKAGVFCVLSTNQEKYRMEYLWERLQLKHAFDGRLSSVDAGALKPSRLFWEKGMEKFGIADKSSVVVWDSDSLAVREALDFGFRAYTYTDLKTFTAWSGQFLGNIP